MAGGFNLGNYSEVKDRVVEFVQAFPNGCIQTEILRLDGPEVIIMAKIFRCQEDVVNGAFTTGIAREIEGPSGVNKTSHIENCETSAIGRALAAMGFGTDKNRPSREEMIRVARMEREHTEMIDYLVSAAATLTEDALKTELKDRWGDIEGSYRTARDFVGKMEKATGIAYNVPANQE